MATAKTTDASNGVRWDLSSFFPEFGGPEMQKFQQQLVADIETLKECGAKAGPLTPATFDTWEELILLAEEVGSRFGHLFTFIACLGSADANNEDYRRAEAEMMMLGAEFGKYEVDLLMALKAASDADFDEFLNREKLKGAEFYLRREREEAQHTMSREQEMLATDLNVNGLHAWGRLYDTITGRLEFELQWPEGHEKAGQKETFPISQWRSLMGSRDRKVGRAAFEGGNRAWAGIETTCASALNAIAGSRFTLNRYRGIDHYLDRALFQSRITKDSLDAMYAAIWENIDVARDIFRAKAGTMGRSGIYWFEREAPLDVDDSKTYRWNEGVDMVTAAFKKAYPSLAEYYEGFLAKRWLESEPRPGKRPGAYCTSSEYNREQRVYMTYNGAIGDVTTMAHEVGHAWHGHLLKDMRPLATSYPMTLAETASIFAEHILAEGIYSDDDISAPQKLGMLDADLCGAATLLLDITVRFEFEKTFHEERQHGEVSVGRLKELMVDTQRRVMGDALMEDGVDPYFWASKLHFYISGVTFYNFPYTFGFLLARTLFMLFKERGESFLPEYEDFLRLTGSDTVENVARRTIDADTTDPAFWSKAITSLKEPLAQYKELLKKV